MSVKGWCRWGTQRRWRGGWRRCRSRSRRQQRGRARCWIVSELQCNRRNWWDDPARAQSCYWQTESQSGACARHHRSDTHVPVISKRRPKFGGTSSTLHLYFTLNDTLVHIVKVYYRIFELSFLWDMFDCLTIFHYFCSPILWYLDALFSLGVALWASQQEIVFWSFLAVLHINGVIMILVINIVIMIF